MEKLIKKSLLLFVTVLLSVAAASCSKDKDDEPGIDLQPGQTNDLVGTWTQTNSAGTVIDVTFNANATGSVEYTFTTGSKNTEFFEYSYKTDSDGDKTVVILSDDCQLHGEYDVVITPTMLTLEGWSGGHVLYQFKRK